MLYIISVTNRRSQPTIRDIAVTLCILKVRRLLNNVDIDILCKLFRVFNVSHIPRSMVAIQEQLHPDFCLQHYYKFYNICSNCGSSSTNDIVQCRLCNQKNILKLYLYSIKQQLQQLLSVPGMFTKLQDEKKKNIRVFYDTMYGKILQEIHTNAFTMIINTDGVTTNNKNLSLWPFIFTLNELPIPGRRYLENVIIGGIVPTENKPANTIFKTCLDYIYEELKQLELGQQFYIDELDEHIILHFYTIASCTDKPAEALMQNVTVFNSQYGCPKCFAEGTHGDTTVEPRHLSHPTVELPTLLSPLLTDRVKKIDVMRIFHKIIVRCIRRHLQIVSGYLHVEEKFNLWRETNERNYFFVRDLLCVKVRRYMGPFLILKQNSTPI